jgi:Zn-dependent oligopeptidase
MMRQIHCAGILLSLGCFACLRTVAQQRPSVQPQIWADKPSIADFVRTEDVKLAAAEAAIAALPKVQGPHTIDNTVESFDKAFMELDDAVGLAKLVREVHPDASFRDKGSRCNRPLGFRAAIFAVRV